MLEFKQGGLCRHAVQYQLHISCSLSTETGTFSTVSFWSGPIAMCVQSNNVRGKLGESNGACVFLGGVHYT